MKSVVDRGATRALVLGLLSMWFGILSPFAIYSGTRSLSRIRAAHGELHGADRAAAGLACGVIGALVIVAGVLYWALVG